MQHLGSRAAVQEVQLADSLKKRQAEPPPVQAPRSELIIFATLAVSLNMPVHHPLSPHLMRDRKGTPTCTLGTATCKFSIALPWHSTYVATDHLTNCFWRTPHEAYNATSPRSHRSRQQGTKHLLPPTPPPRFSSPWADSCARSVGSPTPAVRPKKTWPIQQ